MKKTHVLLPLKDIADIKFCIVSNCKEDEKPERLKWVAASNLLADNIINEVSESEKHIKDDSLLIRKGDIIIKRIQPTFINYFDTDSHDTYAYNNLIIVRSKDIDAKYLAAFLSNKIKDISIRGSTGAVIPSIGRSELENIFVPICSREEQKLIGEVWYKSIEKKKMNIRLAELENIREICLINKFMKN